MSRRGYRRPSLTVALIAGVGRVMVLAAIAPIVVLYYTIKVLAILALALHDAVRGARRPRRVMAVDAAHDARMAALLGNTRHADLLRR